MTNSTDTLLAPTLRTDLANWFSRTLTGRDEMLHEVDCFMR